MESPEEEQELYRCVHHLKRREVGDGNAGLENGEADHAGHAK